jgi:excisionase family DNA binding protein
MKKMQNNTDNKLLLNVREAAELLGISRSFLYELTAKPDFPVPPIQLGAKIMFSKKKWLKWIEMDCPKTREKFEQLQKVGK